MNAADRAREAIGKARAGDARALARLISLVENSAPELRQVAAVLAPLTGQARVVGLTGAPGVGKSTITAALVAAYRERGQRVAVLAVDPTSPFSGGALLGDQRQQLLRQRSRHVRAAVGGKLAAQEPDDRVSPGIGGGLADPQPL